MSSEAVGVKVIGLSGVPGYESIRWSNPRGGEENGDLHVRRNTLPSPNVLAGAAAVGATVLTGTLPAAAGKTQ